MRGVRGVAAQAAGYKVYAVIDATGGELARIVGTHLPFYGNPQASFAAATAPSSPELHPAVLNRPHEQGAS